MKRAQVKFAVIQDMAGFGVGIKQNLKASVQQKSVNLIGGNAPAYAVACFENKPGLIAFAEFKRCGQARKPSADDDGVVHDIFQ
jgi:hypothetical protein